MTKFFWSKTGFVAPIKLIWILLLQSWAFACPRLSPWWTWEIHKLRARASRNTARSKKPTKNSSKFRSPSWAVWPCGSITSRGRTSPLQVTSRRRTSPLQVMWRGAVNRQPGYRARNLQRSGFSRRRSIPTLSRDSSTTPRSVQCRKNIYLVQNPDIDGGCMNGPTKSPITLLENIDNNSKTHR